MVSPSETPTTRPEKFSAPAPDVAQPRAAKRASVLRNMRAISLLVV